MTAGVGYKVDGILSIRESVFFCACNTINCRLFCFRFFFIFSGCMWDRL